MQARYVILRVLLEAGEGLVTITKLMGEDGEPDLIISLDRSRINTTGKKAIGDFLTKLQVSNCQFSILPLLQLHHITEWIIWFYGGSLEKRNKKNTPPPLPFHHI